MSKLSDKARDFLLDILYEAREVYPSYRFMWTFNTNISTYHLLVDTRQSTDEEIARKQDDDLDLTDVIKCRLGLEGKVKEFSREYRSWFSVHLDDCDEIKDGIDIIDIEVVSNMYIYRKGKYTEIVRDI